MLARRRDGRPQIVLLDHGLYKRIGDDFRRAYRPAPTAQWALQCWEGIRSVLLFFLDPVGGNVACWLLQCPSVSVFHSAALGCNLQMRYLCTSQDTVREAVAFADPGRRGRHQGGVNRDERWGELPALRGHADQPALGAGR